jgi:cell division septation protein DedD
MNNVNKTALILSFIFPGFGQIWNREYTKGINFILLQIIFIILVFYPGSNLFSIGMVAMPILWIWGMVDSSRLFYIYSSEHRRVQRRRNFRLTLGIIAFLILSEAIFIPIILTIRRNYKTEEDIYKSRINEIPSDTLSHPENREKLAYASNSTSVDDKQAPGNNNASSSSPALNDFEIQQKQPPASILDNEDTSRPSPKTSTSSSWVITVSVSEKYNEISKLYLELRKKYQVQIIPVSSNPEQNAYAVAITGFANILDAENIANELRKDIPKCFVASYENPTIPVK